MKQVFLTIAILFVLTSVGLAYEGGEVGNGGTIKGEVLVKGSIPQDETIQVTKDQYVCGETLPREKYVISSNGGVKNVIVSIENIDKGKPIPDAKVPIDNLKCAFHPHVQVGVKGQSMVVKNSDPMLHNTHMYLDKRTIFNAALPIQGMEINKKLDKVGIVDIECDAHSWMKGYLRISDNPYITITDEEGNFSLTDVPPGTYSLEFWHEAFGKQEKQVTVEANGTVSVKVEF